jgi:hypothetical protein
MPQHVAICYADVRSKEFPAYLTCAFEVEFKADKPVAGSEHCKNAYA